MLTGMKLTKLCLAVTILTTLAVGTGLPVAATAASTPQSATIAQGFQADNSEGEITGGTIVSLKKGTSKTVQPATMENVDSLIGVVDNKPLLTITNGTKEAQVVVSGTTTVLVSDINGAVIAGDSITPSPIAGIGMKATDSSQIVGVAISRAQNGKQITISDKDGIKHTVTIGRASIQVNISRFQKTGSDLLPSAIQGVANGIAGQQVTAIRVLVAIAVLIIGFASVLMIVSASVRSSVTSIGRNPLAAKDIRRGLYQVLSIALALTIATCLASYLIIRI